MWVGTQNTLGHTVASLGIRPPGYATGGLNDGFANPTHTVSAGLLESLSLNGGGDRRGQVSTH